MSGVGWYPDPGGQPGQYRYWNGSSWSSQTTSTPRQTPPPSDQPSGPAGLTPERKRTPIGWWIGIIAALIVIAVIIWAVVRAVPALTPDNPWDQPGGNPSQNFCGAGVISGTAAPVGDRAGWVSAGHLAFPLLGDPWEAPELDNRMPFGTIAVRQQALDQENYDGNGASWVSSVQVSDVVSGDGFADPQSAATVVFKCVLGKYYADTVVTTKQIDSRSHPVQGHPGWLIESQLSFDVPGLKAKGERVIMVAVKVKEDQYGVFYASVPDTSPDRLPEARDALAHLEVTN